MAKCWGPVYIPYVLALLVTDALYILLKSDVNCLWEVTSGLVSFVSWLQNTDCINPEPPAHSFSLPCAPNNKSISRDESRNSYHSLRSAILWFLFLALETWAPSLALETWADELVFWAYKCIFIPYRWWVSIRQLCDYFCNCLIAFYRAFSAL